MHYLSRRSVIATSATLFAGMIAGGGGGGAGAQTEPFTLPPLPYPTDKNEPSIDATTMEIHHDRHHAAYVKNLNDALKEAPDFAKLSLNDLLAKLDQLPDKVRTAIRNNGGGHANHSMFWQIMGGSGGEPTGDVKEAIDRDLGGFATFQENFNTAGTKLFGSGWVFVTVSPDGKLDLVSKPNQDTPLMEGKRVLFGNDVWEHAYYLKYQNCRPDYLKAWWNVVDWQRINERYAAAKTGKLDV